MGEQFEKQTEIDAIDRFVNQTEQYVKRHAKYLATWLPPLVGFSIFLAYFFSNHFYPSFDLFQFSSLLISAAFIGFLLFGSLAAGIALPGLVTAHLFANRKMLKGRLRREGATEQEIDRNAKWFIGLCFIIPYALNAITTSALLQMRGDFLRYAHPMACVLIALVFGVALKLRFKFSILSMLQYCYSTFLALLLVKWVVLDSLSHSPQAFGGILDGQWQSVAIYLVPLLLSIAIGCITMSAFGGATYSILFSAILALVIAYYSDGLAAIPTRVVSGLGLGSYEANSVILDPAFCEKNAPEQLALGSQCVLNKATVIWSMGDTLTLSMGSGKETRQVQIPAHFVKAIVRQPE